MAGDGIAGHALLVGVPGGENRGTDNDLCGMAEVLEERGFMVDVCTGERATRNGILEGYNELIRNAQRDQPAVFYYTGHGFHAVVEKEQHRTWQGLMTIDLSQSTTDDFRGITSWELSLKQAELTRQTRNVTVILDCCHASQMSRAGAVSGTLPRTLPHPFRLGFTAHFEALQREYGVPFGTIDPISNRNAVRIVACGQDQPAFEYRTDEGTYHGNLTGALIEVLREVGPTPVSWAAIEGAICARVLGRNPMQRPDIEGPARRILFSLKEDDGGESVPFLQYPGGFRILAGSLHGVVAGDVFAILPSGFRTYSAGEAIAELRVTSVSATYVEAQLVGWKNHHAALPPGAVAFPVEKQAIRRPVKLDIPDAAREQVKVAIERSKTLRVAHSPDLASEVVDPGNAIPLATLRLDRGALTIEDDGGPLFPAAKFPDDLAATVKNLGNLAAAQAVRELAGEHGVQADEVEIEWGAVEHSERRPMPAHGGSLALRDKIYVRVRNRSDRPLYAHIFNIGLRGKITLLTEFSPAGVPLGKDGPDFVLGQRHDGVLLGLGLGWPTGMPRETYPRIDEIVVVVTSERASLRSLETVEQPIATRGVGFSKLQDLLAQVQDGQTRSLRGAGTVDGFYLKRLTYFLHPRDAVLTDIPFVVDDNPLRQAAARSPDAWIAPGEKSPVPPAAPAAITVRLTDAIVGNREALSSDFRIDVLVCTRATNAGGGYATWTRRFRGVQDGQRLDLGSDVVFRGTAHDFIEIYMWASRDSEGGLTLEELIAQRATSPETQDAIAALSVGFGARATPWTAAVCGSVILARVTYELLGGTRRATGIYRTAFAAHDKFGLGRHPVHGLLHTEEISYSFLVEPIQFESNER